MKPSTKNKNGKTCMVIGANSRIAMEASRVLASRGWSLVLVGRDPDSLAANLSDISSICLPGAFALAVQANSSEEERILEAARSSPPDAVLLAFGSMPTEHECLDSRAVSETLASSNAHDAARLCLLLAGELAKSGKPSLVAAISSPSAARGRSATLHYGASKAYLSNFLEGLGQRMSETSVGILDIRPGPTRTPMTKGLDGPLFSDPRDVGAKIATLVEKGSQGVAYVPGFWLPIMLAIRHLPRSIFNRLRF